MLRKLCLLTMAGLGLGACGAGDTSSHSGLDLAFARQALDSPCPEVAISDPSPPPLSRIDIRLMTSSGALHFKKSIDLSSAANATIDGIEPALDLSLEVVGVEGDRPTWRGSSQHIDIIEGRSAHANVFMTNTEDMSCSSRPLHQARSFAAAAPLGDGRILIAGGVDEMLSDGCGPECDQGRASAAANVFDPGTGVIYPVAAMHEPRALASATALANGSVLVVGGAARVSMAANGELPVDVDSADLLPSFEVYLPAEDRWIRKPLPDGQGRVFHSATALADGRVLIAGGGTGLSEALDSAIIFDPAGESVGDFVAAGSLMNAPRLGHATVINSDGNVLIIGGSIYPTAQAVEEFDATSNVFNNRVVPSLKYCFHAAATVPLHPDDVLISGGMRFDGVALLPPESGHLHVYNSRDDSQKALDEGMMNPRWLHRAEILPGLGVLLSGGFTNLDCAATDSLEMYASSDGSMRSAGPERLSTPRAGHASVPLSGGRVLLVGGTDGESLLGSGEIYTAQTTD